MLEKLRTFSWFVRRPRFWPHLAELLARKVNGASRHEMSAAEAEAWAAERAQPAVGALRAVGAIGADGEVPDAIPPSLIRDGEARAAQSGVSMGGPGDLDLIYRAILATGSRRVIETGVAYGWSSLAALTALEKTDGRLVSVDMPYPKANNEAFVGIVVPPQLRHRWTLIRKPDRNGIREALSAIGGTVDLIHYDSDKSYAGRVWAYPILWNALSNGGLFISDDIQDNFGFRDFALGLGLPFAVVASGEKFVGLIRKPA